MRIFKIVSGSLTTIERNHAAYNAGPYTSLAANRVNNWAGRIGDRLTGAYQTPQMRLLVDGEFGHRAPAATYSRISRFRVADDTLIADEDAWASFGIMYPSASGNQAGHIGFTVAAGGTATGEVQPLVVLCHRRRLPIPTSRARRSSSSPAPTTAWATRCGATTSRCSRTGALAVLRGVGHGHGRRHRQRHQTPRYAWFGRERDNTAWATTTVWSEPQGVALTCQPDLQGRTGVTTIGYLSYTPNSNYVLTAPLTHTAGGKVYRWKVALPRCTLRHAGLLLVVPEHSVPRRRQLRDHIAQAIYDETRPISIGARSATGVAISVSPSDAQGNGNGAHQLHALLRGRVQRDPDRTRHPGRRRFQALVAQRRPASRTLGTRALAVAVTAGSTAIAAEAEYSTRT
ncbi:MAG: hypothetical protein R3F56_23095 [Planctomycetota bacterium]